MTMPDGITAPAETKKHLSKTLTLADVAHDPAVINNLALPALIDLRRQAGHLAVELDAAIARASALAAQARPAQIEPDRLLSPTEAALLFGVKARWLLEHADEIPGARRLSRKTIRFSERALRRHLAGTRA
jgi:hypothetical protein